MAQRFPISRIIDLEKGFYLSAVQSLVDGLESEADAGGVDKQKLAEFRKMFIEEARLAAEQYYGAALLAAESNEEKDWKAVETFVEKTRQEIDPTSFEGFKNTMEILAAHKDNLDSHIASSIPKFLLIAMAMDFRRPVENYLEAGTKLEALLSLCPEGE
jgi:hypothetical protein